MTPATSPARPSPTTQGSQPGVPVSVAGAASVGVGLGVALAVGVGVGVGVGLAVAELLSVGSGVGSAEGSSVGSALGPLVGSAVGAALGSSVGSLVGSSVGSSVGWGVRVGRLGSVRVGVGDANVRVGLAVGDAVGRRLPSMRLHPATAETIAMPVRTIAATLIGTQRVRDIGALSRNHRNRGRRGAAPASPVVGEMADQRWQAGHQKTLRSFVGSAPSSLRRTRVPQRRQGRCSRP